MASRQRNGRNGLPPYYLGSSSFLSERGQVHQTMNTNSPRATPASSRNIHMRCYTAFIMARIIDQSRAIAVLLLLALAAGCAVQPQAPPASSQACPAAMPCPACPVCPVVTPELPKAKTLEAVSWTDVTGWMESDADGAWDAFLRSCARLKAQPA
jgi:hypothetical protein